MQPDAFFSLPCWSCTLSWKTTDNASRCHLNLCTSCTLIVAIGPDRVHSTQNKMFPPRFDHQGGLGWALEKLKRDGQCDHWLHFTKFHNSHFTKNNCLWQSSFSSDQRSTLQDPPQPHPRSTEQCSQMLSFHCHAGVVP